jgi:hypothetical protein
MGGALRPGEMPDRETIARTKDDFASLVAPVLGRDAGADLFCRILDRGCSLDRIGAAASFFLQEQDDLEALNSLDWEDIRETLEDASGVMDINILTTLMGTLLSLGKLK